MARPLRLVCAQGCRHHLRAEIKHQVPLSSEAFVARMAAKAAQQSARPKLPRRGGLVGSLASSERKATDRNDALRTAYATGGYTQRQIGEHFGLHYSVISRITPAAEDSGAKNKT